MNSFMKFFTWWVYLMFLILVFLFDGMFVYAVLKAFSRADWVSGILSVIGIMVSVPLIVLATVTAIEDTKY